MADIGVPGLVSVIVASYNHAEYLARRMDSLIGQTYDPMEILVIDDGSTDGSVSVLERYKAHPKVRLIIRERNGGWVAVSRQGIDTAAGEFILFAQCDDDCRPDLIERLVAAMRRYPSAGITFCRSLLVDEHGRTLGDDFIVREPAFRHRCVTDTLLNKDEMGRFLLHSCVIPNISAALIRRECFTSLGYLSAEYRACNDWEFFFRVVTRYDVGYVSEPLNLFRQHATTIRSMMNGRATYEEFFRLLLGQILRLDLSLFERCRYRTHIMYLWAMHLLSPSQKGFRNFPFHLKQVLSLDPAALLFLLPGLFLRGARVLGKFLRELIGSKRHLPASV